MKTMLILTASCVAFVAAVFLFATLEGANAARDAAPDRAAGFAAAAH